MRFYGEMRVQGGGPLDGARFDALAYALAEIEETDPAIEDVDLTSSLAQGWVTASMTIIQENLDSPWPSSSPRYGPPSTPMATMRAAGSCWPRPPVFPCTRSRTGPG